MRRGQVDTNHLRFFRRMPAEQRGDTTIATPRIKNAFTPCQPGFEFRNSSKAVPGKNPVQDVGTFAKGFIKCELAVVVPLIAKALGGLNFGFHYGP